MDDIIRRELERASRVFGLIPPLEDGLVLGGDLFAQVRLDNGRVYGVSEAMTALRKAKPNLFLDSRRMTESERATELRRISRDSERGGWDAHDRAKIARLKVEQARYIRKREQTQ